MLSTIALARRGGAVVFAAWLQLGPALAADVPEGSTQPPNSPAAHSVLAGPGGTCQAWTDGCRICRQEPDGKVACSNIGIACQPGKVVCTGQ
ncbi:MAG TPA: hypothetical protein VIY51_20860 [Xanthobacteraceae bacterium]